MTLRSFTIGAVAAVAIAGVSATFGQAPPRDPGSRALEETAARAHSPEQWADRVIRDGYLAAAKEIREGRAKDNLVRLNATVTIERIVVDPKSIDVCFETCMSYGQSGALTCYVNCNAPKPTATVR